MPARIAIVGAKDVPGQPVDRVGRHLLEAGHTVIPVHPVRRTVWGLPAHPDLSSLPEPVDIVVLFRASACCPDHAREVLAMPERPGCLWMQLGIESGEARGILAGSGVEVVEDACVMVERMRLFPGIPERRP
ncbi:MAG: CoA-binding protein [Desulfovibrio sp.]|nr:CoA-binding protein [Desulfovibrio sp.]